MPGNEASDKVHDFFELGDLSEEQREPQVVTGKWPFPDNNSWGGDQRQIEAPFTSNLKTYNILQPDTSRSAFSRDQSRYQPLSVNGFMHGEQGLRKGRNPGEFLGEDTVSMTHNLASRGLPFFKSQQGNASELSPALSRTSERSEVAESPVNLDFFSSQQQLIRGQQSGMPQPGPRQQMGPNDMSWQQQFMLKQMQELQRQHQRQKLDQEAREVNLMNQQSKIRNEAQTLASGAPNHDMSNFFWPAEHTGVDPKIPSSSQMFMGVNMNWGQHGGSIPLQGYPSGLISSQEQGQGSRSMGFTQQVDQSLFGTPVASVRGTALDQYSHLQGVPHDFSDVSTPTSGNQKSIMQSSTFSNAFRDDQSADFQDQISMQEYMSVPKQDSQEKNFLGHAQFQGVNTEVQLGNFHQVNSSLSNASVQEFQGRQQETSWSENLLDKAPSQFVPSQGSVSLDPTEEKILFSTDDNSWAASISGYGNPLESSEVQNAFSSLQSGTWSALMQSAVAEASTSETGLQDEWSGLSLHKAEIPNGIQSTMSGIKQQRESYNNFHSASPLTSRQFHLFDDANVKPSGRSAPGSQQQRTKFRQELSESVRPNVSYENIKEFRKEEPEWLNYNPQQKPHFEGSRLAQPPMDFENVAGSTWPGHSRYSELNVQNINGSWVHRQNHPSYNIDSEPCSRSNSWNSSGKQMGSGNVTLRMHENSNTLQHLQKNDHNRVLMGKASGNHAATSFSQLTDGLEQANPGTGGHHVSRESSVISNSTARPNSCLGTSNQVQNGHHSEYGKHVTDSYSKNQGNDSMLKYQHVVDKNEITSESHNSNRAHPIGTGTVREKSWLSPSDSSSNQTSAGQFGHKAPVLRKFQYHPMGDVAVDVDHADTRNHFTRSQSLSQHFHGGYKEQGSSGYSKFVGHIPNNSTHILEGQLPQNQENLKGSTELPSRELHQDSTVSSSCDGSGGFYAQNKSQNMLELLHKVDQSRENNSGTNFGSSDHVPKSKMPVTEASDASIAQRDHSAASQGFGLQLAPPTQRLPVSTHTFSPQRSSEAVSYLNSRHVDSGVEEKNKIWLNPASTVQPPSRELSHKEHIDNKSRISGQAGNETPQLKKSAVSFTGNPPYQGDLSQHQQVSNASGVIKIDQSVAFDRSATQFRSPNTHSGSLADQSTPKSLSSTTSSNAPRNRSHHVDNSQIMGSNSSYPGVSGQHLTVLESSLVSQPSTSDISRQGAFSMGASTPQYISSPAQSIDLSNKNVNRTSGVQKQYDQGIKEVGNVAELGTCSINSQSSPSKEEPAGKERSFQHIPSENGQANAEKFGVSQEGKSFGKDFHGANSNTSNSFASHLHHRVLDGRRYEKGPVMVPQKEDVSVHNRTSTSRDFQAPGSSLRQGNASRPIYSLLQQVQDMKDAETDPDTRVGKRFKGSDSGPNTQQISSETGRQLVEGNNAIVGNEVNAALQRKSVSGEDQNTRPSTAVPSTDRSESGQKYVGDCSSHLNPMSAGSENSRVSPQMAPSWFEQYGTFKNGKMLQVHNLRQPVGASLQSSETLNRHSSVQQVNVDVSQVRNMCDNSTTTLGASKLLSPPRSLPSDVTDQSLSAVRPKKRKNEKLELLPWHKEVIHAPQRLLNISTAEQEWAAAANRVVEKVENDVEMIEDGQPVPRPRRRIILTTQLLQQLLRPPPPAILAADATSSYATVPYFSAKQALGDACSLNSTTRSNSHLSPDTDNQTTGGLKIYEKVGDQVFAQVLEDFTGRARKLESDFLRLGEKSSILDIRVESEELEKFSVINRFGKFHGRGGPADGGETSSSTFPTPHNKTISQRYVVASPMPKNLPQGVQCLSL